MISEQLKVGKKVMIASNIDLTDQTLQSNYIMKEMAGNGKVYTIDAVNTFGDKYSASVNDYSWMPENLLDAEEDYKQPINVAGEKVLFDPDEL